MLTLGVFIGCGYPDGDFSTDSIIGKKYQDSNLKSQRLAKYTIYRKHPFYKDTTCNLTLILPENFGNVNDIISFTNNYKCMIAIPKPEK